MTRVAWIETVPEDEAEGELAELYADARDPRSGRVDHVLKVHSLVPASFADHGAVYRTAMHAPGDLSLAEREMIGVVVSGLNGCGY